MIEKINELIGPVKVSSDKGEPFRRRMRQHQGWWRAFVLQENPGIHPKDNSRTLCNMINGGDESKKNFLTHDTVISVESTLKERSKHSPGIMKKPRLFNNLLSSQPLCFNFFGPLKINLDMGLQILQTFFPEITELVDVFFEYAPEERYLNDNSAFDVAFQVRSNEGTGIIGFECKYTDDFSYQNSKTRVYYGDANCSHKEDYTRIFELSSERFLHDYDDYVQNKKFNQLFRNQLIAESLVQHNDYDFVKTGLFCHHDDNEAVEAGTAFGKMMSNNNKDFLVLTYKKFIEAAQQLDLDWDDRTWSMLLWARYCATELSDYTNNVGSTEHNTDI